MRVMKTHEGEGLGAAFGGTAQPGRAWQSRAPSPALISASTDLRVLHGEMPMGQVFSVSLPRCLL